MNIPGKRPRIILVDDHPAVLHQTIDLLAGEFEIVDVLEQGRTLLMTATKERIDLIVLDITLPGISGIEVATCLKQAGCSAKIVFLTVHADADYAREAFEVGGLGYVVKPRLASDLIPALKSALAGKRFISPCVELEEFLPAASVTK
jgi:DNA-binding NarL/FixJ family response regulator